MTDFLSNFLRKSNLTFYSGVIIDERCRKSKQESTIFGLLANCTLCNSNLFDISNQILIYTRVYPQKEYQKLSKNKDKYHFF